MFPPAISFSAEEQPDNMNPSKTQEPRIIDLQNINCLMAKSFLFTFQTQSRLAAWFLPCDLLRSNISRHQRQTALNN
jgi:hypothetical protein